MNVAGSNVLRGAVQIPESLSLRFSTDPNSRAIGVDGLHYEWVLRIVRHLPTPTCAVPARASTSSRYCPAVNPGRSSKSRGGNMKKTAFRRSTFGAVRTRW
jgi:hypothetical protein